MSTPLKLTVPKDGVVQSRDHPERGRFPCAICAEERDNLALVDQDRKVVERRYRAVAHLRARHFQ